MDDLDFVDFNDICALGDIFPDIEPYLKDVTESFQNAKEESVKPTLDIHIEGSDSDSGISGDSFATSILKNIKMPLCNDLSTKKKSVDSNCKPQNNNFNNNNNNGFEISAGTKEIAVSKLPVRPPTTIRINAEQTFLNVVKKSTDSSVLKPKQILIKSHQLPTKLNENHKRESEFSMSNITKVKILKHNQGYPIILNKSNSKNIQSITIKNDNNSRIDYPKICLSEIKKLDDAVQKNNSNNDYIFNDVHDKFADNTFESENHSNYINDDTSKIKNSFFGRKSISSDISNVNNSESLDCIDLYNYDMYQSNLVGNENNLSPPYNSFSNCNGIINPQQFDRIIKKQERMIKNRQAASLSRQRKKEYVERLEHKVELQKRENQHLQNQVGEVKERYCSMEQENQIMKRDLQLWRERYYDLEKQKKKQGITPQKYFLSKTADVPSKGRVLKTTAASTTVLGIFILLTFNFNSWSILNQKNSLLPVEQTIRNIPIFTNKDRVGIPILKTKIMDSKSRIGRTLFSIIENTTSSDNLLAKHLFNHLCNNSSGLNLTETTRLTMELNKWGSRYKAESVKEYDRIQNKKIKSQILSKEIYSIYKKSKLRYQLLNDKTNVKYDFNNAELEVYQRSNGFEFLDSIFNNIDRRPDTLYFVSFHSDNLIYPATAKNKSFSTPKITLLLPADVKQEDEAFYKMMKIDCHVQNFTLVNLKRTHP